ncbi:unnamed protein product, partial [Rotaria magnacalcarata]
MRQRLEKKRHEQENLEKSQEIQAESRRSKASIRTDDGNEQRYPEKVILLAKGIKVPWINIALKHGGFKAAALHKAAGKLQDAKLGILFFKALLNLLNITAKQINP